VCSENKHIFKSRFVIYGDNGFPVTYVHVSEVYGVGADGQE
jgi:hypothetical protein